MSNSLLLKGLDGSNPLAFLAALGVALSSHRFCPDSRLSWQSDAGGWRPVLTGFDGSDDEFAVALYETLAAAEVSPFDIDKKLPFPCDAFRAALLRNRSKSAPGERRSVDLLAGFGSDAHRNEDQDFADSCLRMVRSGDSGGNGLLAYAVAIRKHMVADDLRRALFSTWDYRDEDFSLRWDPIEDQRYALRWYDPSPQPNKKHNLRTMRGANILALEALALFPVQPHAKGATTTGFSKHSIGRERVEYFTWPIWESPVTVDGVRSLLCIPELHKLKPQRANMRQIGIVEIYRCERITPNKYYKNFSPAQPA